MVKSYYLEMLKENQPNFRDYLQRLPDREFTVISERLKGRTLREIANELPHSPHHSRPGRGVSPERVRQMEFKAIRRLRQMAASKKRKT